MEVLKISTINIKETGDRLLGKLAISLAVQR